MSAAHSARRDRTVRHSGRYEDPYAHDGFATEPRRYVSDSAYDNGPRRRDDRGHYGSSSGTPYSHADDAGRGDRRRPRGETPGRRSYTPATDPHVRQATDGPLRRQSTQPPRRRSSPSVGATVTPSRHRPAAADGSLSARATGCRRREVEPHLSARRPRPSTDARELPAAAEPSTALVVRDVPAPPTPRRSHYHRRGESADGMVDSPQRRTHGERSERSPRRSARGSTHRSRSTKRREPESGRRSHRERPDPQGTGRYVSPPEERHGASPRRLRSSSRHARRRDSGSEADISPRRSIRERERERERPREKEREKERQAPSRSSSIREPSVRPPAPAAAAPVVPPLQPSHVARGSSGSTFLRPPSRNGSARGATPLYSPQLQLAPTLNSSRRSSSGIEVLGISPRPFVHSGAITTTASSRRRFEPTPTPPQVIEIREKIHETKEWIEQMKHKVERDMEHGEQHRSQQRSRNTSATRHHTPSTRRRDNPEGSRRSRGGHSSGRPSHRPTEERPNSSRHRPVLQDSLRTCTTATSDEPHLHHAGDRSTRGGSANPSRPTRSTHGNGSVKQIPASTNGTKLSAVAGSGPTSTAGRRPPVQGTPSASDVVGDADPPSVIAASAPAPLAKPSQDRQEPPQQIPATINTTIEDDPIFSFPSFLDGNTFHTTAALCQYNVALAEALSDEQLDLMRADVFDHDEVAFAELLYGDDIHAELVLIETTLASSQDRKVRVEMRRVQNEAVTRFADKCRAAREKLLQAADGSLAAAVRKASVGLERAPYGEAETVAAPY